MTIHTKLGSYRWIEDWIKIPDSPLGRTNGRTHGIGVLSDGTVVIFHQANPAVLFYSPSGKLIDAWGDFPGAHGLTLVSENNAEYLWLVDEVTKRAVKTRLNGEIVMSLSQPAHPLYENSPYIPTWVAVAEERYGGNGHIWLVDGYGSSLLHRYDKNGNYLGSLDGSEGAGRFNCPHGIAIDYRRSEAEFHVADRGNARFQVFTHDGQYRRTFGADYLNSPDIGVVMDKYLLVPELVAGLTILDKDDQPLDSLGFNAKANESQGWPNNRQWVQEGKFNSPHSAAVDSQGNIYVAEWITGGRVTKLERCG